MHVPQSVCLSPTLAAFAGSAAASPIAVVAASKRCLWSVAHIGHVSSCSRCCRAHRTRPVLSASTDAGRRVLGASCCVDRVRCYARFFSFSLSLVFRFLISFRFSFCLVCFSQRRGAHCPPTRWSGAQYWSWRCQMSRRRHRVCCGDRAGHWVASSAWRV